MPRRTEYVSAVEAAKLTGLSERTIRRKIDAGELQAEKRGTSYAIKFADLRKLTTGQTATPNVLLERLQKLEESQEHQAAQLDTQAAQISELERRVQILEEQRPAPATTQPLNLAPIDSQEETDEDRTPTQPLAPPNSLPPGSILAAHFARQYGINTRTFSDQIRAGLVPVTSVDRKHWLTPAQQEQIRSERGL